MKDASLLSIILLLFIYTWIQAQHFTPAYQEVDPDGYLFLAKRIARLEPLAVRDDDIFMYQTHQWVETPDGRVLPKFNPGYPLLMAPFYRLGGDEAMFLVSPLMGALTLLGAYLLFCLWMSPVTASMATWALGINPMFLVYTGYLLTHAANTCFVTWGMLCLWRWTRGGTARWAVGAGLLLGYAVAIRYTSLLLIGVIGVAILNRWLDARSDPPSSQAPWWRRSFVRETALLLACYSFFLICLAAYNGAFFGSPFTTGYGLTQEQGAFSWSFLRRNLPTMLGGLNTTALYLIFPLGLAGMLLVGSLAERLMRLFWFLSIVVLYTAYYWAPSGMPYLRFTIVTFPVLVGSAFLLLDRAVQAPLGRSERERRWLLWTNRGGMLLFLLVILSLRYGEAQQAMRRVVSDPGSRTTAAVARTLTHTLAPDAVIFSQRPFFCYLGTREHFRLYDLRVFQGALGSPELRQPKRSERLHTFYASLDESGRLEAQRTLIRTFLQQSRQVVFLLPPDALASEQEHLGPSFRFTPIERWKPPPGATEWGLYQVSWSTDPERRSPPQR